MNISKLWMALAIVLTEFCTVGCGGGDDDDSPGNGGGNNGNGGTTNAEVAVTGTATGITDNSAQITGTVYLGHITISYSSIEYGVQLSTESNFNSSTNVSASALTNNVFTVTATGLSPETTYWYRTYVNVQNTSYNGQAFTFTTEKASATNLTCSDSNHPHMIDLGLPSGTMWACCNVGASKPEDYGGHFAWGETEPKDMYSRYNYDYYEKNGDNFRNIGSDISCEKYDAAYYNWGRDWCMPTLKQMQELVANTTSVWTAQNGVNGRMFTGSNGGKIFLPAAGSDGYAYGASNWEVAYNVERGAYWSATVDEKGGYSAFACALLFYSEEVKIVTDANIHSGNSRYMGLSVRPVRAK